MFTPKINQPSQIYNNWETDYDYEQEERDYEQEQEQEPDFDDYEQPDFDDFEQPDFDEQQDQQEFDDDYCYKLINAHRSCNQEEIDLHNLMKIQKHQPTEINYDIDKTPDAPWINFEEKVNTITISTTKNKKTNGKPNAWAREGKVVSFFEKVSEHQQKIRNEKKLLSDAIKKEKLLIQKRRVNKANLFRSIACKFAWDKRNHCFSSSHRCKNTDTTHRCMYAHTHREVRPAICMYDRLCKNPTCLRLHSVTEKDCNCGENGSSRYYKIICSCERRFETSKEYRSRTGFQYNGDPFTKTHGVKLFEPSIKINTDLVETFKIPSTITVRKQQKYMDWKKRSASIPTKPKEVKMTTLGKFTKYYEGKITQAKGGKVKSIIGETKQKNKKKSQIIETVETDANRKLREDREKRINLVNFKRLKIKEEQDRQKMLQEREYAETEEQNATGLEYADDDYYE